MTYYSNTVHKRPEHKTSMLPRLIAILLFLATAATLLYLISRPDIQRQIRLYGCYIDWTVATKPHGQEGDIATVIIAQANSLDDIANSVTQAKLSNSPEDFICYVKKVDAAAKLQKGYYELKLPISIEETTAFLQNSRIPTAVITISKGQRADEIAAEIENDLGKDNPARQFTKEEFLTLVKNTATINAFSLAANKQTLEGFLYPDKYEVPKTATAKQILDILLDAFKKQAIDNTELLKSTDLSPYDIIILSSIVEREANSNYEDKQKIAGILKKRVQAQWVLSLDSPLLYEKKDWKAAITKNDIATNTPFNTYIRAGLPPTPISNPGFDSIQATLSPIFTDYMYYFKGKDDVIHYAKTESEQEQNKTLYAK